MLRLIAEGVPPSHGNVVGQTGVRKKKWILIADKDPLVFDVLTLLYLSFIVFIIYSSILQPSGVTVSLS